MPLRLKGRLRHAVLANTSIRFSWSVPSVLPIHSQPKTVSIIDETPAFLTNLIFKCEKSCHVSACQDSERRQQASSSPPVRGVVPAKVSAKIRPSVWRVIPPTETTMQRLKTASATSTSMLWSEMLLEIYLVQSNAQPARQIHTQALPAE